MKLSKPAEQMAELLLKHYPADKEQKETGSHSHPEHQGPQQHMHDYRKEREIYNKPTSQKLENMEFFKEEGNNHYKNQRYNEAMYFYEKAIIYSDYTFPENEVEINKMDGLVQQSHCNLALSMIKLNKWKEAKTNLLQASKGKNISVKAKAHYWLSKYYLREGNISQINKQIDQIRALGGDHKKFVEELESDLQTFLKNQQQKSKETFKNMFKK